MVLASAIPVQGHDSNCRTAVEKLSFMAGVSRTTESNRAAKQFLRYL